MNNSTNKILLITVLVSLGLNAFLGIKLYQNRTTTSDVEISYDAINPVDFQQGENVILAQGTSQYPHDALSYLLLVDNEGRLRRSIVLMDSMVRLRSMIRQVKWLCLERKMC